MLLFSLGRILPNIINVEYSAMFITIEHAHIVNKKNPDGPKVLFIRDSYTSTIAPFFANLCSEMDLIWSKGYGGNIEELLEKNDYDIVFVATWPENLEDESFNFYTDN